MVALAIVPARKGSKRFPGKNMALLNGKPLVQIAIEEAQKAEVFDHIVVSTDWPECGELAESLGAEYIKRPAEICTDLSHDYEFVKHAVDLFPCDVFAILRPTSPFRTAYTIRRAMTQFSSLSDSMRAVEKVSQHPRKMWKIIGPDLMLPYIDGGYDYATQSFEELYVQNGCIHVAWSRVLVDFNNVSGARIMPFFTEFHEGIDINTRGDLIYATAILDAARNGDRAV